MKYFSNTNDIKSFEVLIVIVCFFVNSILITNGFSAISSANSIGNSIEGNNTSHNSNTSKVLILSFDDNRKGDFTYAKPYFFYNLQEDNCQWSYELARYRCYAKR
jgi:hypothetical protein